MEEKSTEQLRASVWRRESVPTLVDIATHLPKACRAPEGWGNPSKAKHDLLQCDTISAASRPRPL